MTANSSQYVRNLLFERDHGVCAMCGVDAERAQNRAEITNVWHWCRKHDRVRCWHDRHRWNVPVPQWIISKFQWHHPRIQSAIKARRERMKAEGWDVHRRQSWWEADHIVPVVDGGGQCGIENYRTLCIRCHRKVTRELRARLAQKRKST